MKRILALLLLLACGLAQAQVAQLQAFAPSGNTYTFTANTSGNIPTPVQVLGSAGGSTAQYLLTNIGANIAFISYSNTSAGASTNCVIPTGTSQAAIPVLAFSQIIVTLMTQAYFCGITASGTSIIYVQAGAGQ